MREAGEGRAPCGRAMGWKTTLWLAHCHQLVLMQTICSDAHWTGQEPASPNKAMLKVRRFRGKLGAHCAKEAEREGEEHPDEEHDHDGAEGNSGE